MSLAPVQPVPPDQSDSPAPPAPGPASPVPVPAPPEAQGPPPVPPFILYLSGPDHFEALHRLTLWVRHLLLPVYGREVTSTAPWCSRWWLHPEAVAQLYGLWMAWQDLTVPEAGLGGPAAWHRDHLSHVMATLRDPNGPFAGCKPGGHRAKEAPETDAFPD